MKRIILVLSTFLLSVLLYIDRACISAAKEPLLKSLGLTGTVEYQDKFFGWILAAFALGYALFQVPSGALADRFGPRAVLSAVIGLWSLFTALTGAAWNFVSMVVFRFLFGVSEAGAFPAIARACFSWIPMKERGIVTGINFSGSRIGAALALPCVSWLITEVQWRGSFFILGLIGFIAAVFWVFWFRNDPTEKRGISKSELAYILENRQKALPGEKEESLSMSALVGSKNMWLAMIQYFASNFTFFFCLSWALPYLKEEYRLGLVHAGFLASIPLFCGAAGNWFSGWLLDRIYRKGHWTLSRRIPAVIGFILATVGVSVFVYMNDVFPAVLFLSIAIFGADMTLSPSWAFCIDIGKKHAGSVSGMMNMAGNVGSFVTPIAFPYMVAWTGSKSSYFLLAGALNLLAVCLWLFMKPDKELKFQSAPRDG